MLTNLIMSTLVSIAQTTTIVPTGKSQLVLLNTPSTVTTSENPANPCLNPPIIGNKIYLEVWAQTSWTAGFTTIVLDITYDTTIFDTTTQQVKLDCIWQDLLNCQDCDQCYGFIPFPGIVNDAIGHIDNIGGNTVIGTNVRSVGVEPEWERLGIIEFNVIQTPTNPVIFKSKFAGTLPNGFQLNWALWGFGNLLKENIDHGQICIGCNPADIDKDGDVDLKDYAKLMQNFSRSK